MAVVADAGEPLSPQAADLIRQIARVFLDEPADLMAGLHAAVSAAADEPLRSEPVLAAEVAASNRANVLHLAASMLRDPGGPVPANLTALVAAKLTGAVQRTANRQRTVLRPPPGRPDCRLLTGWQARPALRLARQGGGRRPRRPRRRAGWVGSDGQPRGCASRP